MPQMGESIVEGTITKWLKQIGDSVEKDEPLFEISTDKVDAEIPSPISGVLTEIKFPEGATVGINTVVATLSENGSKTAHPASSEPSSGAKPQSTTLQAPATPPSSSGGIEIVMPQMGESIFEGTITKWLKKVRLRPARRAALRNLHRQSRCRDPLSRRRHHYRNSRPGRRDRTDKRGRCDHRRECGRLDRTGSTSSVASQINRITSTRAVRDRAIGAACPA